MQLGRTGLVWVAYRRMGAAVIMEGTSDGMLVSEKSVPRGLELELVRR